MSIPYNPKEVVGPHTSSYNFVKAISDYAQKFHAASVYVCWDDGIPARRLELYPAYKQNRKVAKEKDRARHEDFGRNREFLKGCLYLAGVRSIQQRGFEADDIIYGLAKVLQGHRVVIVSADMDLAQLITGTVCQQRPGKDLLTEATLGSVVLDDHYDVRPVHADDIPVFKALRGDPGDGISPICRPRNVSAIWESLRRKNLPITIQNVRSVASDLGVVIGPELEAIYSVVNLNCSGVAADAIEIAMQEVSKIARPSEEDFVQVFVDVGMNPGYVRAIFHPFMFLA